jgi:hypothetical protein
MPPNQRAESSTESATVKERCGRLREKVVPVGALTIEWQFSILNGCSVR